VKNTRRKNTGLKYRGVNPWRLESPASMRSSGRNGGLPSGSCSAQLAGVVQRTSGSCSAWTSKRGPQSLAEGCPQVPTGAVREFVSVGEGSPKLWRRPGRREFISARRRSLPKAARRRSAQAGSLPEPRPATPATWPAGVHQRTRRSPPKAAREAFSAGREAGRAAPLAAPTTWAAGVHQRTPPEPAEGGREAFSAGREPA